MLKGLLFIVLLAFIIGAIFLLIIVNYIMSIIRRFRRSYFGEDNDEEYYNNDNVRRKSNQYSFHRTNVYTDGQSRQHHSQNNQNGNACEKEVIVDTRDPHTANRQIISDDEGEYVDFIEEK